MEDKLIEHLKGLNPQKDQQAILIYGSRYKLWRDGKYLGIATWTKDGNVGDGFQTHEPSDKPGFTKVNVFVADRWELVINNETK